MFRPRTAAEIEHDVPEATTTDQPMIATWVTHAPGTPPRLDSAPSTVSVDHAELVLIPHAVMDANGRRFVMIDRALGMLLKIPSGRYDHVAEDEDTGVWIYRQQ